ncbi:MAG: ABC transporter permease subunit [Alphaproteobacteria bacterium]|nr:ABC transporter permease subunit [Alphaproteobacteria bacterium]
MAMFPEARPVERFRPLEWLRENLFSSPLNGALTIVALVIIYWLVVPTVQWAIVNAVWTGGSREACLGEGAGACWPFITNRIGLILYGFYDDGERWRPILTFALLVAGILWLTLPRLPRKMLVAVLMVTIYPVVAYCLLTGGLGLGVVPTSRWGGLLLTMVVAVTGILLSLPLGILLALGRRSDLPVVRIASVIFIEFWRGVPLVTVLFMASYMLPLFAPQGVTVDKLLRALIAVALFNSAYMAEVVRGGLQAVAKGQQEAATALGLGYWQSNTLIILPQALRLAIPNIVSTFIGIFKDTTLVSIIGFFDLLGIIQSGTSDSHWASPSTAFTGYLFAAAVFWVFCFSMSRYSRHMERVLNAGERR